MKPNTEGTMKVAAKVVLVFAAVLALPLFAAQPAGAVACSSVATISAWAALGSTGCVDDDKLYVFLNNGPDTALPGTSTFAVGTILQPPSGASHTVAFGFGTTLAPGTYSIEYSVTITSVGPTFGTVSIDTTVPGSSAPGVTGVKNITNSTGTNVISDLTSTDGNPGGPENFPAGLTFIDVSEVFTVPTGGIISGATNTYTEVNVPQAPAPASLILLGLGLVGAGALRRKMKAA